MRPESGTPPGKRLDEGMAARDDEIVALKEGGKIELPRRILHLLGIKGNDKFKAVVMGNKCIQLLKLDEDLQWVTEDQYKIRQMLDLVSRMDRWEEAEPVAADHLFTVYVRRQEESRPYMEMQVFQTHTIVKMLNNPEDPGDDEKVNLITSSHLKFALVDIGKYVAIKPEDERQE